MISGELFSNGGMATHLMLKLQIIINGNRMKKLENIHPGEVLLEEFIKPLKITAYRLSKDLGIPQTRVSEILKGNRRITADTAIRLSKYFGNSAKFWLGLQVDFDLEEELLANEEEFQSIKKREDNAA
jgi:addiction module HigA family antidote